MRSLAREARAKLSVDLACADVTPLVQADRAPQATLLATGAQASAIGGIDDLAELPGSAIGTTQGIGRWASGTLAAGFLSAVAADADADDAISLGREMAALRRTCGPAAVTRGFTGLLRLAPEIERALIRSQPVVALETSLVAHGLPHPHGLETARRCEQRVRDAGAVPATLAVIDGTVRVGLADHELELATAGRAQVGRATSLRA